jgi:hypothetical protein
MHNDEFTEECIAFAKVAQIQPSICMAFNKGLDMMASCTSAGIMSKQDQHAHPTMLHYRNLDWSMELLRKLMCRITFSRQGEIVADTISYAGYLGSLTGVRKDLSVSLNFRTDWSSTTGYLKLLGLVLANKRAPIGWTLRQYLTMPVPPPFDILVEEIRSSPSSPFYIILCTHNQFVSIAKFIDPSRNYVVTTEDSMLQTNTDLDDSGCCKAVSPHLELRCAAIQSAIERHRVLTEELAVQIASKSASDEPLLMKQILTSLSKFPVTNEGTHFTVVMDPALGKIVDGRIYPIAIHPPPDYVARVKTD